jgi:hypothetical protein
MGISVRSFDAPAFAWGENSTIHRTKLEVEEQSREQFARGPFLIQIHSQNVSVSDVFTVVFSYSSLSFPL